MNNQYRYFRQPLKPRIAQELIQELFAGQTAQRQDIVRAVDEAHLERGGLPKRSKLHPVERALTAMRRSGLAENTRRSVWSIPIDSPDMNNQYQYSEQPLIPNIAQELIQELFEGQTVQKQEIVRAVDEKHLERGGLASEDPVTTALSAMKISGLAENLGNDVWSIPSQTTEQTGIKTLNEFIEWTRQFRHGECLFRGVRNKIYKIQASAYRRPKEADRSFEKFLQINKGLIDEAILRGYNERNGQKLEDLEILAKLQHFGAATCLIDFTYNSLIALWFACQPDSKTPDSEIQPDGKVFAVVNKPPRFKEINSDFLTRKVDTFLQDSENPQLYYWQPRQENNRIIAQQSVFLFGDYEFNAEAECVIAKNRKKNILTELEQASGIIEGRLFPDFDGFARLRSVETQYTQLLDHEYRELGDKQFQNRDYKASIISYDHAIDLAPDYADAYYRRGLAKHHDEQYESAISDFDTFIAKNPNYTEAYYYRAEANFSLQRSAEGTEDLQTALRLAEQANDKNFIGLIQDLIVGGSENE